MSDLAEPLWWRVFGHAAVVTTHFCVECTARDAHMRDYRVFITRDATGEANQTWKEASLAAFEQGFGWVVDVADVVDAWGA